MNSVCATHDPGRAQINTALLIVRIASASAFLYNGSASLSGAFGGPGPQQFAVAHHMPIPFGYLVGLAQFAGGVAVLSGVLIRVGAASIAVVMLGAIFLVHLQHGFDVSSGGVGYTLTPLLLATSVSPASPRPLFI